MDLAKIEELIRIVNESGVSELTVRSDGGSVTIKKGTAIPAPPTVKPSEAAKPPTEKVKAPVEAPGAAVITAPMVGIFHPGEEEIVVGAVVSPGQVVGAIESMKLMNDITAKVGGVVTEVVVEDGLPVEYGQALFRLSPTEVEKNA